MKKHFERRQSTCALIVSVLAIIAARSAPAASAGSALARIEPYLMASQQQEIALARSAAPPSVSLHATVMVLGAHGYVTVVKGSNGFVCLVQRPWDNAVSVKSARFWNPKIRSAFCYNAAGAQSVLPGYLMRTKWVLAGASRTEISDREKAAWAAGRLEQPAPGAMCYMMSKHSWGVGGNPGPWRPHLMFYFPSAPAPNWGANLGGSPVFASADDHTTVFVVLVPVWSDGSPAPSF
jgi:hypothetical protein